MYLWVDRQDRIYTKSHPIGWLFVDKAGRFEHGCLTVEKMNLLGEGILETPLTKEGNYAIITKLRGVAQVVARQFRVLEAASSSPATSTNPKGSHLAPFCIGRSGGEENLLPVL